MAGSPESRSAKDERRQRRLKRLRLEKDELQSELRESRRRVWQLESAQLLQEQALEKVSEASVVELRRWKQLQQIQQSHQQTLEHEEAMWRQVLQQQEEDTKQLKLWVVEAQEIHRQTEARVQDLMDIMVALLSPGQSQEIVNSKYLAMSQDLEIYQSFLGERISGFQCSLEAEKAENCLRALRLCEQQQRTSRLHETLCRLQGELFRRRVSREQSQVAAQEAPEAVEAVAAVEVEGLEALEKQEEALDPPSPCRPVTPRTPPRRRMENAMRETLEEVDFEHLVVREGESYDFGLAQKVALREEEGGGGVVLASRDGCTWEPLKDFVLKLQEEDGRSRPEKLLPKRRAAPRPARKAKAALRKESLKRVDARSKDDRNAREVPSAEGLTASATSDPLSRASSTAGSSVIQGSGAQTAPASPFRQRGFRLDTPRSPYEVMSPAGYVRAPTPQRMPVQPFSPRVPQAFAVPCGKPLEGPQTVPFQAPLRVPQLIPQQVIPQVSHPQVIPQVPPVVRPLSRESTETAPPPTSFVSYVGLAPARAPSPMRRLVQPPVLTFR